MTTVTHDAEARREVNFTVDLKAITELSRSMVVEENWRGAIRLLKAATIPPLPLDDVVDILAGRSMLVGTEKKGQVVPQDPADPEYKRYLGTAEWQQAGILERNGEFYQPYAQVLGFNWYEINQLLDQLEESEDWIRMSEFLTQLCRPFMENRETDLLCHGFHEFPVLFKRVQGPAFWVQTFKDEGLAFKVYLKKRQSGLRSFGTADGVKPFSCDLYMRAAVKGLLLDASDPSVELVEGDDEIFEFAVESRNAYDEEVFRRKNQPLEFDKDGIGIDKHSLYDRMKDSVYANMYRTRILDQAVKKGGFFKLEINPGKEDQELIDVPLAPFLNWAMYHAFRDRTNETFPEWTPVSPYGLKMQGDNVYHTDWIIGAGLMPRQAYDHEHPVNKAAWKYASDLSYRTGAAGIKLAGSGKVTGPVVFPRKDEGVPAGSIAVVSHAGVDYEMALLSACKNGTGAVIAEVGGKMAHLTTVSRELGARLMVIEGAREKFKPGQILTVDFDNSKVIIHGKSAEDDI